MTFNTVYMSHGGISVLLFANDHMVVEASQRQRDDVSRSVCNRTYPVTSEDKPRFLFYANVYGYPRLPGGGKTRADGAHCKSSNLLRESVFLLL